MQKVAVDILESFIGCKTVDDFWELYHEMFKKYELCDDPFTTMPCTTKEYFKNQLEYERQTMIERYGHCDGLE